MDEQAGHGDGKRPVVVGGGVGELQPHHATEVERAETRAGGRVRAAQPAYVMVDQPAWVCASRCILLDRTFFW